jgi:hypothetical protein
MQQFDLWVWTLGAMAALILILILLVNRRIRIIRIRVWRFEIVIGVQAKTAEENIDLR